MSHIPKFAKRTLMRSNLNHLKFFIINSKKIETFRKLFHKSRGANHFGLNSTCMHLHCDMCANISWRESVEQVVDWCSCSSTDSFLQKSFLTLMKWGVWLKWFAPPPLLPNPGLTTLTHFRSTPSFTLEKVGRIHRIPWKLVVASTIKHVDG